jgi:hypothetical protein
MLRELALETYWFLCVRPKKEQIDLSDSLFSKYGHIWKGKPGKENQVRAQAYLNNTFEFLIKKRCNRRLDF